MLEINKLKEYLNLLELSDIASIDESILKKNYIRLSKKYHPDVCDEEYKDGVMFKKVNEAYNYIKDNLSLINDYLKEPSKYEQREYQYNNQYNAGYTYIRPEDLFRAFFNQNTYYTEEDLKNIRKEKKKARLRRKLYSSCFLVLGILLSFVSPFLGLFIIIMSLSQLIFN